MRNIYLHNLFIVIITLSSCTSPRYIYSASPTNNPYFKEKGESKIAAYYSSGNHNQLTKGYAAGFDLHGAYAIGKSWALTAGYFNRRERDVYGSSYNLYDSSVVQYKRSLFDLGGGYFKPLNLKKTIIANIYAGFASGNFSFEDNGLDNNNSPYSRYHKNAITKWFFQPSINFIPGNVRFSFAAKFSNVHYGKSQTSYTLDELQYFGLDKIANKSIIFFEPSFDLQFGIPKYPWVKIDFVFSSTSNYLGSPNLNVRDINGSIGLCFDFSKLKKNKN